MSLSFHEPLALEHAGLQAGGHQHPQLFTVILEAGLIITLEYQAGLNGGPAQPGNDALHGVLRTSAIIAGSDIQAA